MGAPELPEAQYPWNSATHEKHRISGDIVEYRVKTSRLPELHLGDTERGARDIQNAIWCSYGHLIYREKIIKCICIYVRVNLVGLAMLYSQHRSYSREDL